MKLTAHAAQRIHERRILLTWIEATLEFPDRISTDPDPTLTRSCKAIDEFGGRVLRVVHRPDGPDILVITALFDRNAV